MIPYGIEKGKWTYLPNDCDMESSRKNHKSRARKANKREIAEQLQDEELDADTR